MKSFTQVLSIAVGSLLASVVLAGPSQAALIGTDCERPGVWFTIPDCDGDSATQDPYVPPATDNNGSSSSDGDDGQETVTETIPPAGPEEDVDLVEVPGDLNSEAKHVVEELPPPPVETVEVTQPPVETAEVPPPPSVDEPSVPPAQRDDVTTETKPDENSQ